MKQYIKNRFRERKRQIGLLGFLTVLAISLIYIGMTIPKIMAGDTQVSDLILQGESKDQSITLTLKDEYTEDTKIVLPLPEGITYISNSNPNIGVTYDELNKQLVIDWVDGEEKKVELQLEAEQEGKYDFTARTVRDREPVTSLSCSVIIKKETSSEEAVELPEENQFDSIENYSTKESEKERVVKSNSEVLSGVWGTAPWEYYKESETIVIHTGELGDSDGNSAWNQIGDGGATLKKIIFDGKVIAPANSQKLFMIRQPDLTYKPLKQVEEIENLSMLDTSRVTDMSYMFAEVSSVTSLDVSSFDTRLVINMSAMFNEVSSVTNLDVSSFDTSRVTNMSYMFAGVSSVTSLDVSSFDTSRVTNMTGMFNGVSSVTNLDVSSFDTSRVTNMAYMFNGASSVTNLDVSSFDTSNVTDMAYMFNGASSVTSLDASSFDTSRVTNMAYMFNGASSVTNLDVSSFDTSNVQDMSYMFNGASPVTSLDVSSFDTSRVTNMSYMFAEVSSVTSLDVSSFDTRLVINMSAMFAGVSSVTSLDVSSFDTSRVTNISYMFAGVSSVTALDVSSFDTSNVTNMTGMFNGASSVTSLDVSSFDTSNVTNMTDMFKGVSSLRELKLGKKLKFSSTAGLEDRNPTATETGKWQNVGLGTTDKPTGEYIFTSAELLENYNGEIMADTYVMQPKPGELRFEKVPELLTFETSKISNRTKEVKRKDDDWSLTVEDTRLEKKNWRVAVELSDPFKDVHGNEAKGDLLFFRNALGEKQWINNNGTTVFDGTSSEEDYYKVSWEEDKGLLLEVAPGEVKVGNYQSTLNWTLVDAPA